MRLTTIYWYPGRISQQVLTILLLLGGLFSFYRGTAQKNTTEVGFHVGSAVTRLWEGQNMKNDYGLMPVIDCGIQFSYGLGQHVSLTTEINYAPISSKREGLQPLRNSFSHTQFPKDAYAVFSERLDLHYMEVPILLSGHIGDKLKLGWGVGPFIGIRLNARRRTLGESLIYRDSSGTMINHESAGSLQSLVYSKNITSDIRSFNIGGCERLSVSYPIGRSRLWMEFRYSFGQMDIWKEGHNTVKDYTERLLLRFAYTMQL